MIDTDKYEGHSRGNWSWGNKGSTDNGDGTIMIRPFTQLESKSGVTLLAIHHGDAKQSDLKLIADAPLILQALIDERKTNAFLKRQQKVHCKALDILSSRGAMSQDESEAWSEEGVLLNSLQYSDKDSNGLEQLPAGQYYVVNLKDSDPDLYCFTTWKSLDKFLMDNEWSDWFRLSADNEKQAKSFYTERALWFSEYQFMNDWMDDTDPYPKFMKEHGFTAENPELNAWLTRVWGEEE